MSFLPIYESSYEVINFKYDNFMDYFHTPKGKKLLLENNIKDVNDFDKYYLYEKFIKNFDFYIKENKKIDVVKMKNQIRVFCEELVSAVFHPKRLNYYLKKYNYNICSENYQTNFDTNIENKKIKNNHKIYDFHGFHLHKKRKFSKIY
jgi:hypothetical protein